MSERSTSNLESNSKQNNTDVLLCDLSNCSSIPPQPSEVSWLSSTTHRSLSMSATIQSTEMLPSLLNPQAVASTQYFHPMQSFPLTSSAVYSSTDFCAPSPTIEHSTKVVYCQRSNKRPPRLIILLFH